MKQVPSPRARTRLLIVLAWLVALAGWAGYLTASSQTPTAFLARFVECARDAWWAPIVFLAAYLARPLLLFPASVATIAGGILFGPVWGSVIVILASNLSALLAYSIGRSLRTRPIDADSSSFFGQWGRRLRTRSFATVVLMRLAFLPYDLVNYACGYLAIRPRAFLAATAIGSLPATLSFVLAGASIEHLDSGIAGIDGSVMIMSAALLVLSLGGARWLNSFDIGFGVGAAAHHADGRCAVGEGEVVDSGSQYCGDGDRSRDP